MWSHTSSTVKRRGILRCICIELQRVVPKSGAFDRAMDDEVVWRRLRCVGHGSAYWMRWPSFRSNWPLESMINDANLKLGLNRNVGGWCHWLFGHTEFWIRVSHVLFFRVPHKPHPTIPPRCLTSTTCPKNKNTVFCVSKCTCSWSWLSSCNAQLSSLCVECYNIIIIMKTPLKIKFKFNGGGVWWFPRNSFDTFLRFPWINILWNPPKNVWANRGVCNHIVLYILHTVIYIYM
jgi:hypothetical protein